mgnify:CR=1 FL=1
MKEKYKVEGLVSLANYEKLKEVVGLLSWEEKEYIIDVGNGGAGASLVSTMPLMTEELEDVGLVYTTGIHVIRAHLTSVGMWVYDMLTAYRGIEGELCKG